MGNRLTAEGVAGYWAYNINNELTGYDDVSCAYDDNGNMIQKTIDGVVTNYIYNIEDRLTEVRDDSNNLIASYYYDPFGRRLWKDVGGVRTCFLYSDEGLIGEYDAGGAEIKTYGYRPSSTWTTDPLFMKIGTEYYFYHNDYLGTPQKMTMGNGEVVWSAKYSSFGEADVDASSTVTSNLRFPGQYYDAETGLHYNYHRYYDPTLGRYLRADPIGLNGGINLYLYADGNPIIHKDPLGYIVSQPTKCAKAIEKARQKCEEDFDALRCDMWDHFDDCQDKFDRCKFGDCSEGNNCDMFENCNSPSCARLLCAKDTEKWLDSAKKNISRKCYLAMVKVLWACK